MNIDVINKVIVNNFINFGSKSKIVNYATVVLTLFQSMGSLAQSADDPTIFPELTFTKVKGAPVLSQPMLILGNAEPVTIEINHPTLEEVKGHPTPVITQGHGLAAPAFWDWDGDGLEDLLIGEFKSGAEFGRSMGNFIRVHPNVGTRSKPEFSGGFNYASPPHVILTNGTPYSVDQSCCMAFTPQFVDLNGDGYKDIVTGQYYGEVSWFQGSEDGFLDGRPLIQEGNPREKEASKRIPNQPYWLYSSASFGDFTGDGLPDMIVGGRVLRISKNVGTLAEPKFSRRELLLDIKGKPLKVYDYTSDELDSFSKKVSKFSNIIDFDEPYTAGDYKLSPYVTDWDNDGVLDLLVTNSYSHKGLAAIDFFRGVKVSGEYRFEHRVPLFTTGGNGKALPGISPLIFVTDWNHDGINDLLIGTSTVTIHGKFNSSFSWSWEKDTGLLGTMKDPGFLMDRNPATQSGWKSLLDNVILPSSVTINDFLTMRHQGYVFIMIGNSNEIIVEGKKK